MANLPDGSGDAYSNLVQGDGSASLTFVMPGTVPLAVGSVVATVDNSAGADTTATLVIRDPAGEVIATKRQGVVIPAGATGTATWALRLDDEQTGGSVPADKIEYVTGSGVGGQSCAGNNVTQVSWVRLGGDVLLDYTDPLNPTVLAAGFYSIATPVVVADQLAGFTNGRYIGGVLSAAPGAQGVITYSNVGPAVSALTLTTVEQWTAGMTLQYFIANSQPTAALVQFAATIVKLQ